MNELKNQLSLGVKITEPGQKKLQFEQFEANDSVFSSFKHAEILNLKKEIRTRLTPFQSRFKNKKDAEEYLKVINEITRNLESDPLERFYFIFKQLHGNFEEKLFERCPDLTKSERLICAMLRLNLRTKEIARLFDLCPSSIDITRHHIRKKFKIEPKVNLTSFLIMI